MISCTVTYPPSANRLWRAYKGRQIKSEEYRNWIAENTAPALAWPKRAMIVGPYVLNVVATAPDKRRRDLDNLLKPLGDLIQALGLVSDDCNMTRLVAEWGNAPSPGVVLTIDVAKERVPGETMIQIVNRIAKAHGISADDLRWNDSRARAVSWPRQEAYAAMSATGRYSVSQIARFFERDHTTVIYGIAAYVARETRAGGLAA